MLGGSGTGKTMFLRMLAGVLKPDHIAGDLPELNVRFKPQKLAPKFAGTVRELLHKHVRDACGDPTFTADVMRPMQVRLRDRHTSSAHPFCALESTSWSMLLPVPSRLTKHSCRFESCWQRPLERVSWSS